MAINLICLTKLFLMYQLCPPKHNTLPEWSRTASSPALTIHKGGLYLENRSRDPTNFNMGLAEKGWTSGKHYWEISIINFTAEGTKRSNSSFLLLLLVLQTICLPSLFEGAYCSFGVAPLDVDQENWIGSPRNGWCYTRQEPIQLSSHN